MALWVVAHLPDEFATWLAAQAEPASAPADPVASTGLQIFLHTGCVDCHTIRGTDAAGQGGPDLTHLGSRKTLAGATLPNTPEHLAEWVRDPQAVKPGALMSAPDLSATELAPLLAYLETLQ
jgi:cytochrome c oxidase subunit 2